MLSGFNVALTTGSFLFFVCPGRKSMVLCSNFTGRAGEPIWILVSPTSRTPKRHGTNAWRPESSVLHIAWYAGGAADGGERTS